MKRMLSLLIALAMLMSVCSFAVAESIEAPEPKEGETVVNFWCIMWEPWNQDWLKTQVYNFNAKEDRPFYVLLELMDGGTWNERMAAARASDEAPRHHLRRLCLRSEQLPHGLHPGSEGHDPSVRLG